MLSPFAQNLAGKGWRPSEKLIPNLYDKTHYVTHYRNLQFYIRHGLVHTKTHRVLSFSQRPWLKPWIDLCTAQRQAAQSDFEADVATLQVNATYGKTMEQVRNRVNIRLRSSNGEGARQKVLLNKPIAVGFSILDLSKLTMYQFYYDYLKAKYNERCCLLFTDTDSMCCKI